MSKFIPKETSLKWTCCHIICVISMAASLAGCGDIEWFPEQAGTPTTTSTNTNASTSNDTTNQNATVLDATGNVKATNLVVAEVSRNSSYVEASFKVDVTNVSTAKTVYIDVIGKNSAGLEVFSTGAVLNGRVESAQTMALTATRLVDPAIFPSITSWSIKKVEAF